MHLSSVDFPEPLGPSTATTLPAATLRSTLQPSYYVNKKIQFDKNISTRQKAPNGAYLLYFISLAAI